MSKLNGIDGYIIGGLGFNESEEFRSEVINAVLVLILLIFSFI